MKNLSRRRLLSLPWLAAVPSLARPAPRQASLVPAAPGSTPSYWCTWGEQNRYSVILAKQRGKTDPTFFEGAAGARLARNCLNEKALFQEPGWATLFPEDLRPDLYLVLDDGWDVPYGHKPPGNGELNTQRFPSFHGTPPERLAEINQKLRALGWRGLGLWIVAGEVPPTSSSDVIDVINEDVRNYWRARLEWSRLARIGYWKVDWGKRAGSIEFRRMLTSMAKEWAPGLTVEHAYPMAPLNIGGRFEKGSQPAEEILSFSDVFRTYDALGPSVATTLDRIARLLVETKMAPGSHGILNCETNAYLAAGLGCSLGIMDNPPDPETVRAVRWQRIAPAVPVSQIPPAVDPQILTDTWRYRKGETWYADVIDREVAQSAPARMARGMELPEVVAEGERPFVVAMRHPNHATAVATLPRTFARNRECATPPARLAIRIDDVTKPIGVFGAFEQLTLQLDRSPGRRSLQAQDLLSSQPVDITHRVTMTGNSVQIPGSLLRELSRQTDKRSVHPGVVIQFA